ncbi:hypothetical protein [Pararhizobium sp. DWP1-1-3]|uniref:hypothetical protein n=1 Tax=Pararhizobium sp. DWP1-1-3 TaxID=2804652 RepID=UPI003CEDF22C
MRYTTMVLIQATCISLTACTSPGQVAKPSDITLERAIIEVADSLKSVQQQTADRKKVGMIVDEVKVEFQIAAKATNTAGGSATATGLPVGPSGAGGLSVSNQLVNEGSRGNTVTVTFKNIATANYSQGGKEMADKCKKDENAPGCPVVVMSQPGGAVE